MCGRARAAVRASQPSSASARTLSWRERFLIGCGPGVLAGITLGDWLRLLSDNRYSVDSAYLLSRGSSRENAIFTASTGSTRTARTTRTEFAPPALAGLAACAGRR